MNKLIPILLLAATITTGIARAANPSTPPEASSGSVKVTVVNAGNGGGDLVIALFPSADGFPKHLEKCVQKIVIPADAGAPTHAFARVPYGTYAVAVFHDENRNGKLDTNLFGMPREGVGVSNHVRFPHMGMPKFEDARFEVDRQEVEVPVTLKY